MVNYITKLGEEVLAQSTPYDIADDNVVHTYVFGASLCYSLY